MDPKPVTAYEWTCPICGASRVQIPAGERSRRAAANSLRTHIRSSDDDRHGPSGTVPDAYDLTVLDDHVAPRRVGSAGITG